MKWTTGSLRWQQNRQTLSLTDMFQLHRFGDEHGHTNGITDIQTISGGFNMAE